MIVILLICLSCIITLGYSIPPSVCFEPFNWEDCGQRPVHVLYYYKSGSRCEVAVWRGCRTRNMFKDEYECINTCIFTDRAMPDDYHSFDNYYDNGLDNGIDYNDTIIDDVDNTTTTDVNAENVTAAFNETDVTETGNTTDVVATESGGNDTAPTEDTTGGDGGGDTTPGPAGDESPTTEGEPPAK